MRSALGYILYSCTHSLHACCYRSTATERPRERQRTHAPLAQSRRQPKCSGVRTAGQMTEWARGGLSPPHIYNIVNVVGAPTGGRLGGEEGGDAPPQPPRHLTIVVCATLYYIILPLSVFGGPLWPYFDLTRKLVSECKPDASDASDVMHTMEHVHHI